MRMNLDLIRDILLQVENEAFIFPDPKPNSRIIFTRPPLKYLDNYSNEEIIYHLNIINQENWLIIEYKQNAIKVLDLTSKGHFFLSDIRTDEIWEKSKIKAKQIGIFSLTAIKEIATKVISEVVVNNIK